MVVDGPVVAAEHSRGVDLGESTAKRQEDLGIPAGNPESGYRGSTGIHWTR
jgi:hypothetical protein